MDILQHDKMLKAFDKGYLAGLKYGIETLEKRLKVMIPQESTAVKELIEELKEELNNRK